MLFPNSQGGRHEASGTGAVGTLVTAHATVDTKGSYTAIIAATSFDYHGFFIQTLPLTANCSYLLDIAVDQGGTEKILVSDVPLMNGFSEYGGYYFPIFVAAGSTISIRAQASVTSGLFVATTYGQQAGSNIPIFSRSETIGALTASSQGTQIDSGAVVDTKGSIIQIAASTGIDYKYMSCYIGHDHATLPTQGGIIGMGVYVGGSGVEDVIMNGMVTGGLGGVGYTSQPHYGLFCDIKAGTRISADCQCNNTQATDRIGSIVCIGYN